MRGPDVVVVGGGVIGCAVAWALAREGVSCRLLERDQVGAHASSAAAGMLAPLAESAESPALRSAGLASLARLEACLPELRALSGIDPLFARSGILRVATPRGAAALRARAGALAEHGCEWVERVPLRKLEPRLAEDAAGALWSPAEGQVHPGRLTRAYAAAARRRGAEVLEGTPVVGLLWRGDRVHGVRTPGGAIEAERVVLCAGAWCGAGWPGERLRLPVEPVRGQMLELAPAGAPFASILWGEEAYLVPARDGGLLVGATVERAGFDVRVTAEGVAELLAGATRLVPELGRARFVRAWAGLRPGSADGLPLVGAVPGAPGLLVASGHFRNGILLSCITGEGIARLVLEEALPDELRAFDPARLP